MSRISGKILLSFNIALNVQILLWVKQMQGLAGTGLCQPHTKLAGWPASLEFELSLSLAKTFEGK